MNLPRLLRCVIRALALTIAVISLARAQTAAPASVAPHSVPLEFASDRFGVTVNGKPVTVFFAAMNIHFASFDFTGDADVRVEIKNADYNRQDGKTLIKPDDYWQGRAVVRPLSRDVQPKTDRRNVTFTLKRPGQYSIERPTNGGFEDEVLFLFANAPEKNAPLASDPNVLWLGPGVHYRNIDLSSGQTLYLAGGAVLFGCVNVWDAENVRLCGRGTIVYYGPQSRNVDTSWKHERYFHPLTTHAVKGLSVEGVTFVGRSRGWTIQMWQTFDATFDNIKIIAAFPENLNGDGMDWYGGGRATVRDSFFRVADDCFCIHPADASRALRTDRGGGGHLPGAQTVTPATSGEVSDITIERCVFWPTIANIFRAGWINQSLTSHGITLRDCDVIHISSHEWMGANDALFSVVSPNGQGNSRHSDYLFENIRCEEPAALLAVNWTQAQFRNIRFKDIQLTAGAAKGLLRANADGLSFENIRVADRPATSAQDLKLTLEGDIRNVIFSPEAPRR